MKRTGSRRHTWLSGSPLRPTQPASPGDGFSDPPDRLGRHAVSRPAPFPGDDLAPASDHPAQDVALPPASPLNGTPHSPARSPQAGGILRRCPADYSTMRTGSPSGSPATSWCRSGCPRCCGSTRRPSTCSGRHRRCSGSPTGMGIRTSCQRPPCVEARHPGDVARDPVAPEVGPTATHPEKLRTGQRRVSGVLSVTSTVTAADVAEVEEPHDRVCRAVDESRRTRLKLLVVFAGVLR